MRTFHALGIRFPGAEETAARELPDLRAADAPHPDAEAIAPPRELRRRTARPAPGSLVEGSLPGDPDARFLLRIPRDWNGELAVAAAPGLLSERAYDRYWSDALVSGGFAFAVTDKGAALRAAADAVYVPLGESAHMRRWPGRLAALARLAARELAERRGRAPERCFALGLSNGGYAVRRALEESPELFDGGLEVSGVLWRAEDNLLAQLPTALRAALGKRPDPAALEAVGFDPATPKALFQLYGAAIWELVLAWLVAALDPEYGGPLAEYRLEQRPPARAAAAELANTGKLGRPLISVYGAQDPLLAPRRHFEGYAELVRRAGCSALHRVVRVARAGHNDADLAVCPQLEPLLPHALAAFAELREWVSVPAAA